MKKLFAVMRADERGSSEPFNWLLVSVGSVGFFLVILLMAVTGKLG